MKALSLETMASVEGGDMKIFCTGFIAGFGIGAGTLISNPVGLTVALVGIAVFMASDSYH